MNHIKFISEHMKGHRYKVVLMVAASLVYVAMVLMSPLLVSFFIDNIINDEPFFAPVWESFALFLGGVDFIRDNLWINAIVIMAVSVISAIALFIRSQANGSFSEHFSKNLRDHLYDHLQTLPYSYHVKAKTGDLIQRCTSDVDQIWRFLSSQVSEFVYALAMVVISCIIMLSISLKMTLITMIAFPIIFLFAYVFFKKMQKAFKSSDEAEGELSTVFQESLSAVRVVKAFNRERYEIEKFEKKNALYRDKTMELIKLLGIYWGISDVICFLQILLVVVVSIFEVRSGALTTGNAIVFISYVSMVLWPVRNVGRILSDMGKVTVSIDRLNEILHEPKEDLHQGIITPIKGWLEFQHVSFQYVDGTTPVLSDVSFVIEPGETVAIMGPTGSGKSSLVHLLTRLYDPSSGVITVDGVDLSTIAVHHIRQHVGIVLQEPYLFSKTIYDNIRLAMPDANDRSVHNAAKIAAVHHVIETFDQGYRTVVGEKGVTLSGGQKQRIAIARTIINRYPILVFDDSLSALDTQTDAAIRRELASLTPKATTLIVTHRINTAQTADKIIVIFDGKVQQIGTHESLLQEAGLYRRIAAIQNSDFGGDQHESAI